MERAGGNSRITAAKRRMRIAETGVVIIGVSVFAAGIGLVRAHAAGHTRHPRALAAPPKFVRVVQQDALQGGLIAPGPGTAERGHEPAHDSASGSRPWVAPWSSRGPPDWNSTRSAVCSRVATQRSRGFSRGSELQPCECAKRSSRLDLADVRPHAGARARRG